MKNVRQTKVTIITSIILVVILIITGCYPVQIQKVDVQNQSSYKYYASNYGLKISIDPYFEEDRLEKYFGIDLLSNGGILPVLVVLENVNAEDGFILVKEKSKLIMKPTETKVENTSDKEQKKDFPSYGNPEVFANLALLTSPIGLLVFLPAGFAVEKHNRDVTEISRNLNEKSLVEKTVYQGGSHNGFLYFKVNSKEDTANIEGVQINLKNIRTKENLTFTVNLIKNP